MEVGEWVLTGYTWAGGVQDVVAVYERDVGSLGKARCEIRCLPHQAPSIALDLLRQLEVE